jgi:stage III sporulation protein AG
VKEKLMDFLKGKKAVRLIFIIGIASVVLIFASDFFHKSTSGENTAENDFSQEEYLSVLEQDITRLVSGICGDTAPIVTVTLETGLVYEYADETKQNSAADKEKTSEESEKTYITVKNQAGGEVPLIITSHMPQIRGVAVICNVSDEETAEKIEEAVAAALDITLRQIYIGRKS